MDDVKLPALPTVSRAGACRKINIVSTERGANPVGFPLFPVMELTEDLNGYWGLKGLTH